MVSINDLREPIEVYEAAEGDPTALIEFLRSDKPINEWMRQELAEWLDGNLPVKFPHGRKTKDRTDRLRLKFAWELYQAFHDFEIPLPDELATKQPKNDEIKEFVAGVYGLEAEHFIDFMKRPIKYRSSVTALGDYEGHPNGYYLRWKRNRKK
ncbi:MAG: hypothetical protein P8N72_07395 [Flavimaricola sp.]|nr:hypothetical protein [Flavimaricola sp.]